MREFLYVGRIFVMNKFIKKIKVYPQIYFFDIRSIPKNITSTGRKYDVQPKQILDWKRNLLGKEGSFKGNPKKKSHYMMVPFASMTTCLIN